MKAKDLLEQQFEKINKSLREGDYSIAPYPLLGDEARLYLIAQQSILLWVLEMWDE